MAKMIYFRVKAGESDVFLGKSWCKFQSWRPMGPSLPPTPNSTTCVNSQTGKSKQSRGNVKTIQIENTEKAQKEITLTPTSRSSVDDLLRHTPDAVNESTALEEEEVANNLDHTNR